MKKRALAFVLSAMLLFATVFPAFAASAQDTGDTVLIRDRAGLEAIAENPSGNYLLAADIDMKEAPWQPISFSGHFDGGGHTLYNLSIREPDMQAATSVDGNQVEYDTVFAALFSRCVNASIQDLNLLGVDISINTEQNCFAAGLAGYAENTRITGCSVEGRVYLYVTGPMCGVSGMVGFGYGTMTNVNSDVTLTLVDGNETVDSEEFMGGLLATGYMDIDGGNVTVDAYTSVHGYVHNGGVVGMYYVHTEDKAHQGYVNNCSVDAVINFFEDVESRRAYSSAVLGEQLHWTMQLEGNITRNFESNESTDFSTPLLPEKDETPVYAETVTQSGCEGFGYTTYTCENCGYSYKADYVAPAHQPGEWAVVRESTADESGLMARSCTLCGQVVEEQEFISPTAYRLGQEEIRLEPEETVQLTVAVEPEGATEAGMVFSSSDEGVARVDSEGMITALASGDAVITCASPDGAVSANCRVTVGGGFPLLLVLVIVAIIVVVVVVVIVLSARRRKNRARRRAERRTYYRR